MTKIAQTRFPILEIFRNRWSPRAFSEKMIEETLLLQFFEAASWSFSAMNEQPWRYIYAFRNDEAFNNMLNCLAPANQVWAKNAAVLILNVVKKQFTQNNANNPWYMHDAGAANLSLILEAQQHGVYGHVMGGFNREMTAQHFPITQDFDYLVFIALGHLGAADSLPDDLKARELSPRNRKPLNEFTFKHKM